MIRRSPFVLLACLRLACAVSRTTPAAVVGPAVLLPDVLPPPAGDSPEEFRRGDANGDERIDISDAVSVLGCLFIGSSCPRCDDAADANDDGIIDVSDGVLVLSYLFQDGAAPPAPALDCGPDPSGDALGCGSSPCAGELPAGTLWTHHRVPEDRLREMIAAVAAQGGSPRWLSGYPSQGAMYYAVIFEKAGPVETIVDFGLQDHELDVFIAQRLGAGFRIRHLDSNEAYLEGSYSVIFEKASGPAQVVLHGLQPGQHQTQAQELVAQGYRPMNVSVTDTSWLSGRFVRHTSLWEKGGGEPGTMELALTAAGLQNLQEAQSAGGLQILHLDSHTQPEEVGFSAILGPAKLGRSVQLRRGLDAVAYRSALRSLAADGYRLRCVTGAADGPSVSYAALWSRDIRFVGPRE